MRQDIRFAGTNSKWTSEYAKKFCKYIHEIGYLGRVLTTGNHFVVAYSHRQFTSQEADECLKDFTKRLEENEGGE